MVVDVVQNPQKSNVYEHEKQHVRCVGVYSGMMYGCVRYVLRVARVDSGWGDQNPVCCILTWCRPPVDRCTTVWVCHLCIKKNFFIFV